MSQFESGAAHPRFRPELDRFWEKVNKQGPIKNETLGPCWIFSGFTMPKGYRLFKRANGKSEVAHRSSWEFTSGAAAGELCVLHRCDTPACVNPNHLFLGSKGDNNHDRNHKDRQAKGEGQARAKLTTEQVIEIRRRAAAGERQIDIAPEFGVAAVTIGHIVQRRKWKHV